MPNKFTFAYNSFIKNIYLEIPGGYHFWHQAITDSEAPFLGRTEILDSFANILDSDSYRGAYLVTGYRGMGKTSFVRQTLKNLEKKRDDDEKKHQQELSTSKNSRKSPDKNRKQKKPIEIFNLSLAQSELKDIDILKHIVNQLLERVESTPTYRYTRWFSLSNVFGWVLPFVMMLLITLSFWLISMGNDTTKTIIENLLGITSASALVTFSIYKIVDWSAGKIAQILRKKRYILLLVGLGLALFFIWMLCLTGYIHLLDSIVNNLPPINSTVKALLPGHFTIIFFMFLLSALTMIVLVDYMASSSRFGTGIKPIKQIHERLKLLHNRCNAQMTSEDQFRESISSSVTSLFKRDVMIYPIANAKEIESELIGILNELKFHFQCIFVFDELDKVDPTFDYSSSPGSDTNGEKRTFLNDLRERRHVITHILGSLKYFINEAEAKFIFIAGREMFEAALADISDRQSSISSIFHRVIYVDSFLKDQSAGETIASSIGVLVEKILEDLLLGPSKPEADKDSNSKQYSEKKDFFSEYYIQLIKESKSYHESEPKSKEGERIDRETSLKARKTIFVLQNFLGYLVYRSNGSPKKVRKLLEEYIIYKVLPTDGQSQYRNIIFENSKSVNLNSPKHYLHFSYYDQYTLGFTAYLFQPFLTMYSSFMKRYSDSTLVSTPYLIDNLIKFHPFAFSAQNLELIPEILSTNKSPISRPFLEELITFLGQNHIRRTESGLFEYKFYDRTHNEITFISKISEEEAAAFNFTLDENFTVKAHLISKIRQLRTAHRTTESANHGTENPISSIIFLNRILGDVRFQDEEYEDAIVCYQDAIQMLSYDRLQYSNNLITFVRLRLKLGLAYEKIKAYEFALGHYAGVIEEGSHFMIEHAQKHNVIYRELLLLVMQAYSATLYLQEKLQEGITFQKIKHIVHRFRELMDKFEHEYYNRDILLATFYSNIGTALYYKNMVLPQKVNEKWVAAQQANTVVETLTHWVLPGYSRKKSAVAALLKCFPEELNKPYIITSARELLSFTGPGGIHSDARISTTTYIYYKLTLKTLLGCPSNKLSDILKECPRLIRVKKGEVSYRSLQHIRRLTAIGHALAQLGDYLLPIVQRDKVNVEEALGCFYSPEKPPTEPEARQKILFDYFEEQAYTDLEGVVKSRLVIHIYYLAALFYLEAAETANAAFQLRKILFTLRSLKFIKNPNDPDSIRKALKYLESNLVKRILELSSWMSHSSDRPQLSKTKKYFTINTLRTPHDVSSELYGNLSNNPDTKETILAYALLKTQNHTYKPGCLSIRECFETVNECNLLSPYNSIAHFIIRIMELELHTNMNYKLLQSYSEQKLSELIKNVYTTSSKLEFTLNNWEAHWFYICKLYDVETKKFLKRLPAKDEDTYEYNKRVKNESNEKEFEKILEQLQPVSSSGDSFKNWVSDYVELVLNSIFNLTQIDKIINTYGINYILSNSYMAQIHEHLGTWLKHLHLCRILNKRYELAINIEGLLEDLVGAQSASSLDALTSYQVAMQYYYRANQLHKEGDAYRNQINNLIYLEDDYNDNLYHFGAALERLRINTGLIRKRIDFLKKELETANMYKYSTYVGGKN